MRHGVDVDVGKGSLAAPAQRGAAPDAPPVGKHTLTEQIGDTARAGVGRANQPFPHLDALRPHLGAEQHAVLARTPAAIGGHARAAAVAMGTAMGGEVRGWALDNKVAFPGFPTVPEAMHEGAHVLGAGEAQADRAADLVSRGRRVEELFGVVGRTSSAANASPQFIVLSEIDSEDIRSTWTLKGLAARTINTVLEQNLKDPQLWPTREKLENHLARLLERANHIKNWLKTTQSMGKDEVEVTELVDSDGKRNQGIFLIKNLTDNQQYIIKALNPGAMTEFNDLKKLNNDPIAQPGQGDNHPSFPRFVEAGPSQIPSGFKTPNPQLGIMTAAPGKSLLKIHDECLANPELAVTLCQIYEVVGQNMASFNFKHSNNKTNIKQLRVYSHNDMNPSNVFYDSDTRRVTLIDNDGVGLHELGYVDRDTSDLLTLIAGPIAAAAGKRRTEVGPGHGELPEEVQLGTEFKIFNAFVKGYLAKMPDHQNAKVALLKAFAELRTKIMSHYLEHCKHQPEQEVLTHRFPDYFLQFE
jgi:hypothetical protein